MQVVVLVKGVGVGVGVTVVAVGVEQQQGACGACVPSHLGDPRARGVDGGDALLVEKLHLLERRA